MTGCATENITLYSLTVPSSAVTLTVDVLSSSLPVKFLACTTTAFDLLSVAAAVTAGTTFVPAGNSTA